MIGCLLLVAGWWIGIFRVGIIWLLVIGYWLVAAELANFPTNNKPGDRLYAEDLV